MKTAALLLLSLLGVFGVSAQTVTNVSVGAVSVNLPLPCVAKAVTGGKGETVALTGTVRIMFHYVIDANGAENGFLLYSGTLRGVGSVTKRVYIAVGTTQQTFKNFLPSQGGDGDFAYYDNYQTSSWKESVLAHQTQEFTIKDNGNTLILPPMDIACK